MKLPPLQVNLTIQNPLLWWPNGYGEQPLYTAEACLLIAGAPGCVDTVNSTFGVRKLELADNVPSYPPEIACANCSSSPRIPYPTHADGRLAHPCHKCLRVGRCLSCGASPDGRLCAQGLRGEWVPVCGLRVLPRAERLLGAGLELPGRPNRSLQQDLPTALQGPGWPARLRLPVVRRAVGPELFGAGWLRNRAGAAAVRWPEEHHSG